MKFNKYKMDGVIGTIVFHAILLLVFIFFGLTTPLPLPGEEGVEVNIGSSETGKGIVQKTQASTPKQNLKKPKPKPVQETKKEIVKEKLEENIISQKNEETPSIQKPEIKEKAKIDKKEIKSETEKNTTEETSEEEIVEEVEEVIPEPTIDPKAMYTGKNNSSSKSSSEGKTYKGGNQGNVNGTENSNNYDGQGGTGSGISFSLSGRSAKHLPKPAYNTKDQGKIVVTIWVNKLGKVVKAVAGAKGTNITNQGLQNLARKAALRAKFSIDPNAAETQKGTITYNFIRLN